MSTPARGPQPESRPAHLPPQHQQPPGREGELTPQADHGEQSYQGADKLKDRVALITGGDSGIGKAVAIAYAREGADQVISYRDEHEDAKDTASWAQKAGRKAILQPGDLTDEQYCINLVKRTVQEFGRVDILVCNAAFQMSHQTWRKFPARSGIVLFELIFTRCFISSRQRCRTCGREARSSPRHR